PFTCLREVDLQLPLPDWKRRAIAELGYGQNAKLFAGCSERVWRKLGYAGYAFADNGIINGYDHTHMQNDNRGTGGYTIFLGGHAGLHCNEPTLEELSAHYIPALDAMFPGFQAHYNGVFQRWHWPSYRFAQASYVCFRPGQYTTLSGAVEKPVGNLYFAGEHCNYVFQGFMNGAAQSARQVVNQIVAKLGR
ncbi:MAG: FAD-dependent oxidoreductase, partial [Chitinophagales bacterium]|nr:FAD-dependent oxidoreductase [Chitinophagales bacterium]